jgi:hypothetical protein
MQLSLQDLTSPLQQYAERRRRSQAAYRRCAERKANLSRGRKRTQKDED